MRLIIRFSATTFNSLKLNSIRKKQLLLRPEQWYIWNRASTSRLRWAMAQPPTRDLWISYYQQGPGFLQGNLSSLHTSQTMVLIKASVAFAAPYPGTIIPVDLKQVRNTLIVQKDGFLCAAFGTKLSITLNKRIGAGLLGGEGFILQKLEGDGKAFIHAGGTVIERQLNNETLRIDTGCIVAFEPSIDFDIEASGSLKSMVFRR